MVLIFRSRIPDFEGTTFDLLKLLKFTEFLEGEQQGVCFNFIFANRNWHFVTAMSLRIFKCHRTCGGCHSVNSRTVSLYGAAGGLLGIWEMVDLLDQRGTGGLCFCELIAANQSS